MLFILTGDVQIGKSRWLERVISELQTHNVHCYGVIAPGVWVESDTDQANEDGFEKLGIDNVLLPANKRVHFAIRKDIAEREGTYKVGNQADNAKLIWHISDDAIDEVNSYIDAIPEMCDRNGGRGLLVVDELGRLELLMDGGLTAATRLLQEGPRPGLQNALIIVRDVLADIAEEKFAGIWGSTARISPDDTSEQLLLRTCE